MEKAHLVICPQQLRQNRGIIELLLVWKQIDSWQQKVIPLTAAHLSQRFPDSNRDGKEAVLAFSESASTKRIQELEQRYAAARAGVPFDQYYPPALLRELRKAFTWLKPVASQFAWYYRVWKPGGNQRTAPCTFSAFSPDLRFNIVESAHGYRLQTKLTFPSEQIDLANLERFEFLCWHERVLYLLPQKVWETLQWLDSLDWAVLENDPNALLSEVVTPLEKSYPVERASFNPIDTIEVNPSYQVLVREISKQFLMLTPQWIYDGIVLDGPFQPIEEIRHPMGLLRVVRQLKEESPLAEKIKKLHPSFEKQRNGNFHLSFQEAQKKQWFYKAYHQLLEEGIPVVGMDLLEHFRYSAEKPVTTLQLIETNGNWLTISLQVQFGAEKIRLYDLQQAVLHGQKSIPLRDGSMGVLPQAWLQQYSMLLKHGKLEQQRLVVAKWLLFAQRTARQTEATPPPEWELAPAWSDQEKATQHWWERWQTWQQSDHPMLAPPASFEAQLRPYQQKGFEWIQLLADIGAGGILADDMGLGKTIQAMAFLCHRLQIVPNKPMLIACPTSLLFNWQEEWQRYAPRIPVFVYHGAARSLPKDLAQQSLVLLTTYGTLRSDVELLTSIPFDTIVVDESHNIKNPAAQITRAIQQLQAVQRLALSGTPVMNNTVDLFAQIQFVLPGLLGSHGFFRKEYADPIDRYQDAEKKQLLQQLTQPFILRRTKEQVAPELPEKTEQVLWCTLPPDQRQAYDFIRDQVRSSVFLDIKTKGWQEGKLSVINGLLRLRQACNAHALLNDNEVPTFDSIKIQRLLEELRTIGQDHKALIFSQFTKMLDVLEPALSNEKIHYIRLDGQTPASQRQALVNQFQSDPQLQVMLISLKAGNAGLNLTAADYVFLIDPWWNTAVEQQAIDRTHRIGQTQRVFAYRLICRQTIEEKIRQLQERKHNLANELVGEETGIVKSLTEEDLEFLLSD